ncbi:MAG: hypothetical protein GXO16_05770, partial [Epsilonproteobacteria bacterium]|nr:hypothetical protein [Campylobacterota bacterium]
MGRLSKEQWRQLKADYVTGAYTLQLLARKYGVSVAAISKRARKEKWKKLQLQETAELLEMQKVEKRKKVKVEE